MSQKLHLALTTTAMVVVALAHPGAARAAVGGPAQIVSAGNGMANSRDPLRSGSVATAFSLRLPAGAACSGDSLHDQYRVQSFMVRDGVSPSSLTFGELGPEPTGVGADFRQALYQANTEAFVGAATQVASTGGGAGTIINIPVFTLAKFSAQELPTGNYTVGLACTKGPASATQLDRYWSTTLDLTGTAAARTWTAPVLALAPQQPTKARPSDSSGGLSAATNTVDVVDVSHANAAASRPAEEHTPVGGEPSFGIPAFQVFSGIRLGGAAPSSVLRWIALFLLAVRLVQLLARRTALTPIQVVTQS